MPLRGKTPFALLASLLFTLFTLEFASAQSGSPVVTRNDNKPAVGVSAHDGNQMLKACKAYLNMMSLSDRPANDPGFRDVDYLELMNGTYCKGYLMGIVEEQFVWAAADPPAPTGADPGVRHFCLPDALTPEQEVRVIVKWLEDHPEQLHEGALVVVHRALGEAFSCAQQRH